MIPGLRERPVLPSSIDLDRRTALDGGLVRFVRMAWPHVEAGPYVHGWHIEEVCAHLEAVARPNGIRKLVVNIPPGCMKSLLIGVFWPVWVWLRDPSFKWLYWSFDPSLPGRRDGGKVISLLSSQWYGERWGFPASGVATSLKSRAPSAYDFSLCGGGWRFATSPGGKGTGRHANCVVGDDPVKPLDTMGTASTTKKALGKAIDFRHNTLSTRRADPKTHREVLVMQRLSFDDPTADMLRDPGVEHLKLPMKFRPEKACVTSIGGDRRTLPGELLFPDRFDSEAVESEEYTLGPTGAAAQHAQEPQVIGGGIFRRTQWRFWSKSAGQVNEPCLCDECWTAAIAKRKRPDHDSGMPCVGLPTVGLDAQSWDMAFKGKTTSDFVAGGAWRAAGGRYYLRAIFNSRIAYAAAKLEILRWEVLYPCPRSRVLVEDAANGPAIASDLPGVALVTPQGGKEARAQACGPSFALGHVFVPHPDEAPGVWELLTQCEAFPNAVNDDMVDMLTQAIVWYRGSSHVDRNETLARLGAR